jgi:cell wall-associated NlpC family hydrolase
MCLDPVTATIAIAVGGSLLSAAGGAIASKMQVDQQNAAAMQQYDYQKKQAALVAKASQDQLNETLSRQRLQGKRDADAAQQTAQQQILENLRRQATAQASASTAGITGTPLQMLFNDYQVAAGNIASNLETQYGQLNQNLFFGAGDAGREAQSRINAAQPAPPFLASWSPLPHILGGLGSAMGSAAGALGGMGGGPKPAPSPSPRPAQPLPPVYGPNGPM